MTTKQEREDRRSNLLQDLRDEIANLNNQLATAIKTIVELTNERHATAEAKALSEDATADLIAEQRKDHRMTESGREAFQQIIHSVSNDAAAFERQGRF